MIKRVKIHGSIDKRGKSSLIYFPSGLKTSIKIEFQGGKNELELPTWWLWAVTLWDLNLSYKAKSKCVFMLYSIFHLLWTECLTDTSKAQPTQHSCIHGLVASYSPSLLQRNYSPGGQSIAISFMSVLQMEIYTGINGKMQLLLL